MDDKAYYQAVVDELERDDVRGWLWKNALVESGGDEAQARSLYIPMRIRQMKERRAEYAKQIGALRDRAQRRRTWGTGLVVLGSIAVAVSLFSVFEKPFMGLLYALFLVRRLGAAGSAHASRVEGRACGGRPLGRGVRRIGALCGAESSAAYPSTGCATSGGRCAA